MRPTSRITTRSLLLTVALAGPGCLLSPEIVGETLTTTAGGGDSDDLVTTTTGDGPGAGTTTAEDGTAGPTSGAYGSACALVGFPPVLNYTAISSQPACDGGICLLVIDEKYQCEGDLDCEASVGNGSVCEEDGLCTLSPALLAEDMRCTQTCESAADCPEFPGCMTGTTCTSFVVSGELCCQKVCACEDSLYLPGVMSLQTICDEMPDFCA